MKERIVIIPTYNEIENIEAIIKTVMELSIPFNILVVDDGSPDGTADVVKKLQKEFPERIHIEERTEKSGLGTAYIHGFKKCLEWGYEYIFEMDADFSHNPNDLIKLYDACKNGGAKLSIGSRYVTGVNVVNWPMNRVLLSYFASRYVKIVTGMPFHDSTAGFVCYHRSVLEFINLEKIRFVGYAFQIEMKHTAWLHGFNIQEVPIIFTDRTKGTSKMSKRIVSEAIMGVIQLKLNSIFKSYKKVNA